MSTKNRCEFNKNFLELANALLNDCRTNNLINSEKDTVPNIPELLYQAQELCDSILYGLKKENEKKGKSIDSTVLTAEVFCLFAGMGAIELWNRNCAKLKNETLIQAIVKPKGVEATDEYVFCLLGIEYSDEEMKKLLDHFYVPIVNIKNNFNPEDLNYKINDDRSNFNEYLETIMKTTLFREELCALFCLGMTYRFEELEKIEISNCQDETKLESIKEKYEAQMVKTKVLIQELEAEIEKEEQKKREEELKREEEQKRLKEQQRILEEKKKKKRKNSLIIIGIITVIIAGIIIGSIISDKVNYSSEKLSVSGKEAELFVEDSNLVMRVNLQLTNNGSKTITELRGKFELLGINNVVIGEKQSVEVNGFRGIRVEPHETQDITMDMALKNINEIAGLKQTIDPGDINLVFTITTIRFSSGKMLRNLKDKRGITFDSFNNMVNGF